MAEEKEKTVLIAAEDRTRIGILEGQVCALGARIDDLKSMAAGMADMKDAILRLTLIQEQMQEDSRKRDLQFIEYTANAERQWKKIAKIDVRLENMTGAIIKVTDDFKDFKKRTEEALSTEAKAEAEIRKTRLQGRWALVAALLTSLLSLAGVLIATFLK